MDNTYAHPYVKPKKGYEKKQLMLEKIEYSGNMTDCLNLAEWQTVLI